MKILIGCDERSSVDKLYYDFKRAGFPPFAEICVLSVANVLNKPVSIEVELNDSAMKAYQKLIDESLKKSHDLASHVCRKLKAKFPAWHFHAESAGGSAAQEIVKKATAWKADVIVVGSHGRAPVGKLFFGSVALKVLATSPCSVRIVRGGDYELNSPSRVVVGVDGSAQSDALINVVMARKWKKGSAVHLITAVETKIIPTFPENIYGPVSAGVFTFPEDTNIKKEWKVKGAHRHTAWIKKMHMEYAAKLQNAGLLVSSFIKDGDPKVALLKEAQRWGADSIFLGALGHSALERFLIGSVSSAIATRAHCSVEVVRSVENSKLRDIVEI